MLTSPTPKYAIRHRCHVQVPMRDGVCLSTDLAIPAGPGPWPVVLTRTPYGNNDGLRGERLFYLARRGFVTAFQDCRGRYDSDGEWEPFVTEREDAEDTLGWLAAQDFCNGSIGMTGRSYEGYTTWVAAAAGHPALKAIVPIVPLPDPVLNVPYQNGALFWNMCTWALMVHGRTNQDVTHIDWPALYTHLPLRDLDSAAGYHSETWRHWMEHPRFDAWWKRLCYMHEYGRIAIPALHICGWYDDDGISTYLNFPGMRKGAATPAAREEQRLIVGCWPHATNAGTSVGELDFGPQATVDLNAMIFRFFAVHLTGEEHGYLHDPRCRIFLMGENRWHGFDDWPVPGAATTRYYLHSGGNANTALGDGALSLAAYTGAEPSDSYDYDPGHPAPYVTDPVKLQLGEACDQQAIERRPDVLCYTSAPLEEDVVVCGRVFAELFISSDAEATDFTAKLVDVYPGGRAIQVCDGLQRAEFRAGLEQPQWLEAGQVYKVTVDMWATGLRFLKGHRVRLEVSSSAVPKFARHLNTREDITTATTWQVARQTVHHSAEHPSALVVDVLPGELLGSSAIE